MLKIITPQDHDEHQLLIGSFLNFLKIYQGFSLPLEVQKRATFLITENDVTGVYGGAILYPHPLAPTFDLVANESEEESLNKMFSAFQFQEKEYWRVRIGLYIGDINCSDSLSKALELCDHFYQDLYGIFKAFGSEKSVDYLPFTIHMADVLLILPHKEWPYFLEVNLDDSSPNYFHGILSLNGRKFMILKKKRMSKQLNIFSKIVAALERKSESKDQKQSEDFEILLSINAQAQVQAHDQSHTDRPVQ